MQASLAVDCQNSLGEGTFYDIEQNKFWWVDIAMPSKLQSLDITTNQVQSIEMPEMISYAVPKKSGGFLVASHGGLNNFDVDSKKLEHIKQIETTLPFNRSNDACCDFQGNLWVGTMQNNIAPDKAEINIVGKSGSLYRVDTDLNITHIIGDICISNSCCFSPDASIMYYCDTPEQVIWAYDFDVASGKISNKRDFAKFDRGSPDGATVDSEGGVWSARYGGSCVVRFLPDGSVDQVIEVPVSQITCCSFGGPELDTLYITSARMGLSKAQLEKEPQAGGLFSYKTNVKGIADVKFAG